MAKPRCYFDITVGGKPTGRIDFEVSTHFSSIIVHITVAHTQHSFFFDKFFHRTCSAVVRVCAIPLLTVDTFFCYLQLRADVVPKTAGLYKACSVQFV